VVETGLPVGAAVEAVRIAALYQAAAQATEAYDREHVTPFLYRTPGRFRAEAPLAPRALRRPDVRLTVDTPAEFDAVRAALELAGAESDLAAPLQAIIGAADRLRETREALA
jgi:spore coat polysaccharide biosynthesis protein SpsF